MRLLRKIRANGAAVRDLSPLARLVMLEDISLNGTEVSDILPLAR